MARLHRRTQRLFAALQRNLIKTELSQCVLSSLNELTCSVSATERRPLFYPFFTFTSADRTDTRHMTDQLHVHMRDTHVSQPTVSCSHRSLRWTVVAFNQCLMVSEPESTSASALWAHSCAPRTHTHILLSRERNAGTQPGLRKSGQVQQHGSMSLPLWPGSHLSQSHYSFIFYHGKLNIQSFWTHTFEF